MPADQPRNRTVGSKMTDSEYEKLAAVAEQDGQTLGEWCREVLLERAEGRKPSAIEGALLAEVLALRTILLNAFYKLAQGEKLTEEGMQGHHRPRRRQQAPEGRRTAENQTWRLKETNRVPFARAAVKGQAR